MRTRLSARFEDSQGLLVGELDQCPGCEVLRTDVGDNCAVYERLYLPDSLVFQGLTYLHKRITVLKGRNTAIYRQAGRAS